MYRITMLTAALLIVSGGAVADDTVSTDKASQKAATDSSGSDAGKQNAAKHVKSEKLKTVAAAATQKNGTKGDAANSASSAPPGGDVKMSGMSILGNEEAPKSLVIVPWKSSQMGDMPSVARLLDSSTQPVDKDVFLRELAYYEIRANAQ
jgi:hypothetical protein